MAGAAIGVSHLVQSTRAGADYGMQLAVIVVLAHVIKYPFFEYGHRYAAATGEHLLDGYARLGRGYVAAFVAMMVVSSVITVAGVTFVTAGLAQHVFGTPPGRRRHGAPCCWPPAPHGWASGATRRSIAR
jgi:Mn2+/Fe2+ NRAMP family transporter